MKCMINERLDINILNVLYDLQVVFKDLLKTIIHFQYRRPLFYHTQKLYQKKKRLKIYRVRSRSCIIYFIRTPTICPTYPLHAHYGDILSNTVTPAYNTLFSLNGPNCCRRLIIIYTYNA